MRTVEMKFEMPDADVSEAIAYFTMWSYTSFDKVTICNNGENDLIAYYSQSDGERHYVIGAVYREELGNYSFHS